MFPQSFYAVWTICKIDVLKEVNVCYVNESVESISIINIQIEFNLSAKICISSASSIFESEVDRAARTLKMLIPNADEMTCSRKMRVAKQLS